MRHEVSLSMPGGGGKFKPMIRVETLKHKIVVVESF